MKISVLKLRRYMDGLAFVPDQVLLRAVDLLTENLNPQDEQSLPDSTRDP